MPQTNSSYLELDTKYICMESSSVPMMGTSPDAKEFIRPVDNKILGHQWDPVAGQFLVNDPPECVPEGRRTGNKVSWSPRSETGIGK